MVLRSWSLHGRCCIPVGYEASPSGLFLYGSGGCASSLLCSWGLALLGGQYFVLQYFVGSQSETCTLRFPGRSSQRLPPEPLKPDALLRLSLGGLTLTLLEHEPPRPGSGGMLPPLAEVSRVFFSELAYFKDTMFSGRDFSHLRQSFVKACPHSHLRCVTHHASFSRRPAEQWSSFHKTENHDTDDSKVS